MLNRTKELFATASSVSGWFYWQWYYHRRICCLVLAALLVTLCYSTFMVFPEPALALPNPFEAVSDAISNFLQSIQDDFLEKINGAIDFIFAKMVSAMLQPIFAIIGMIDSTSALASFDQIFGSGTGPYVFVMTAHDTIMSLVGYGILAIIYLVQLVKISSRFDGNGIAVPVREVFFLAVFCFIFKYLIDNSFILCVALFDWVNGWAYQIQGAINSALPSGFGNLSAQDLLDANALSNGNIVLNIIGRTSLTGGFAFIVVTIAGLLAIVSVVVAYASILGRGLQVYIYTIFAPIPLALLGAEVTRSYGMGFIKNYLSLCLTGVIIVIIVGMFPYLVVAGFNSLGIIGLLVVMVLFIMSLTRSGQWARDVLGG